MDLNRLVRDLPLFSFIVAGDVEEAVVLDRVRQSFGDAIIGMAARLLLPGKSLKITISHERDFETAASFSRLKALASELNLAYAIFPGMESVPEFRLAIMDMDSTLIDQEVIEELADFAGMREHVARVTTLAMEGKLDFHQALRERVKLLEGQPATILDEVFERRISATGGLAGMMAGFKSAGIRTAVVSGGFSSIVNRFAAKVGIDHALANELEIVNGKLTGQVLGEIVDGDVKRRTLLELCRQYRCEPREAIAIGDGANDLKMIRESGLGVAFCAKPIVREQALAAVHRRRLDDVLLFLA